MKKHIFHEVKYDLGHFSDLITTLIYVLMDNFCPCFTKKEEGALLF